jgi:D-glycerate 3-kinase
MSEAIQPLPQEQPQEQPLGQEQEALTLLLLQDCRRMIQAGHRPVLGLNGPVGSGKSTLSRQLRQEFARAGLQLAVASIDDAYLPWAERRQRMAGNPFGVSRVPPGSHDPAALAEPIRCWREQPWSGDGRATAALDLPRFDKTLRDGEGDRTSNWHGQADAVLLEGWLLGCRPVPEQELLAWSAAAGLEAPAQAWLQRSNQALLAYLQLWGTIDQLVMLWPSSWNLPRRWRFQAEARQRRSGGGWLRPERLDQLVQATLQSLPAPLYQRPLLQRARWVRELDARRRCRWQGPGGELLNRLDQSSSACSSATG